MPTFTPIALDHLLEPRSHTQPHKAAPKPPQPQPPAKVTDGPIPVPAHPIAANRSQASLVLYTTPESTPVQDSPSSYPPSPYIINHKRRGPCLLKTLSQGDVGSKDPTLPLLPPQPAPPKKSQCLEVQQSEFAFQPGSSLKESCLSNGTNEGYGAVEKTLNENNGILPNVRDTGESEREEPEFEFQHGSTGNLVRPVNVGTPGNSEYFDIQDSLSIASNTDADDTGGIERMLKPSTPVAEFYDAFDEISSDGATRSSRCIDDELREMRLSLLMEIERRKQAEEAFENLQNQWKRLSHHLSLVALTLPPPAAPERTGDSGMDYGTELCQQITVSRFVAAAVASGLARSEVESQMEPLVAAKNFEIARLSDRVQYYEAANREMSQRNQEAIEMARQERNKRKKRQKWFWGSVGLAVTLGAAAIAWSYLPSSSQPAASQDSNGTDSN